METVFLPRLPLAASDAEQPKAQPRDVRLTQHLDGEGQNRVCEQCADAL